MTRGFTRQVIAGLTRFGGLVILGAETGARYEFASDEDRREILKEVDFMISGGCAIAGDRFSVEALLIDAKSLEVVWGDTFERDLRPCGLLEVRDEVSSEVARVLAQTYGVIFSRRASDIEGKPPEALSSYESVLSFYQYWRTFDRTQHAKVRRCLESTIARDPEYAEAFACLSHVYADAFRFRFAADPEREEMLDKSLDAALRAIALAPRSSRAQHALAMAFWFSGDVQSSIDAFNTALSLNPNATEVMADLGQRYAMLADWDKAVPLLEQSYAQNPAQPGTYRIGLFLYHFAHDRFPEALAEARKVKAPDAVYGHLAEAMALSALGRKKEAAVCLGRVAEIDPAYAERVMVDLIGRGLDRSLVDKIVRALRNAGMPVRIDLVETRSC